jgi:hypothetical protein
MDMQSAIVLGNAHFSTYYPQGKFLVMELQGQVLPLCDCIAKLALQE